MSSTPSQVTESNPEPLASAPSEAGASASAAPTNAPAYPRLALLAKPWSYNELPAWSTLLKWLRVYDDARWAGAPARVSRGKLDGYFHKLELADPEQRETFFLGRHHDLAAQMLLTHMLRTGDTFVDANAQEGMYSLLAARRLGPSGCAIAVESDSDAFRQLRTHVEMNRIDWISLHRQRVGSLFTPTAEEDHVESVRGDELMPSDPPGAIAIRFDAGEETPTLLDGFVTTLSRYRPTIMVTFGTADPPDVVRAIEDRLRDLAYDAYSVDTAWVRFRTRLYLRALGNGVGDRTAVWLATGGPHWHRLKPWLASHDGMRLGA